MDRDEMNSDLKEMGLNQARVCRALGLSRTTPVNWKDRVPNYVRAYIFALRELDDVGRMEAIHKSCVAQKMDKANDQ